MIANVQIHPGVTDPRAYHAPHLRADGSRVWRGDIDYIMSQSRLKEFDESPRRWKALNDWPEPPPTRPMRWGSLMDCLVTTPHLFEAEYGEEARKDKGRKHFSAEETGNAKRAAALIMAHSMDKDGALTVGDWLDLQKGDAQVMITFEWHDEFTGLVIQCRACLDYRGGNFIIDLKTAHNIAADRWYDHCLEFWYFAQAWLYKTLCETDSKIDHVYHVAQLSKAPFDVETYEINPYHLALGRAQFENAMKRYCRCLFYNGWPGATQGWEEIETPNRRREEAA